MEHFFLLFFSAAVINNIVLTKFLGLCPFFGISRDLSPAVSMGMAVTAVMILASMVTWPVYVYLLVPYTLEYLQTVIFILIVATLVQLVEMGMAKFSPALQRVLGIYLPLITTNCAILGVCLMNIRQQFTFVEAVVHAGGTGAGFAVVICVMAGIRERLMYARVPAAMQGFPISFIIGCLMALSAFGFHGFFTH
jgi:Na+-translocating ferredoxin:NAD+ oxidoreductase subunit A